jgi:phosphoserine aminotransferase
MSKVHNFSAGPSILPQEVIKQAAEAVINFNNLNLSLLEISHRSKDFIAVMDKAKALVKELLNVPDGYSILFLQGGASLGFLQVPYNYMKVNGKAAYVNTGVWATKAQKEAKGFGEVIEVASSKDKNFSYIPKNYQIPNDADYIHITSNNTIFGTQFKNFPVSRIPMIADMSSDIFSKKIDVSQFDMIYAGAQKNMGPAGTILFIVKDSSLGKTGREIPTMLDFRSHIKGESMFNTPPVFAVYVSMLTLQWLKDNGGVEWMERTNQQKADLMYSEIDNNPMFEGTANKADRSNMNATFVLKNESLTEEFNKMWAAANISGIVGHRDVGGYRASMYNALPLVSVQALVDVMKAFAVKYA